MNFLVQLAIYIVVTVLIAVLRPKQKSAKPDVTEPPDIEAGKPIAVVWGTCKVAGTVVWWGHSTTVSSWDNKVGGRQYTGFHYVAGMQIVLCHGPVNALEDIIFDNDRSTVAQPLQKHGSSSSRAAAVPALPLVNAGGTDQTLTNLFMPLLFGGISPNGGGGGVGYNTDANTGHEIPGSGGVTAGGDVRFHFGEQTQTANAYLATRTAPDGAVSYKYPGLCYIVFEHVTMGMSPYIRPIHCVVRRCPNAVGTAGESVINGTDANPIEMIYEAATNVAWGCGWLPSVFDIVNLQAACTTLKAENMGMSWQVTDQQAGEDVIEEILRHINAVLYTDPISGLVKIKLIRPDYSVGSLTLFDVNNTSKVRWSRPSYQSLKNQARIRYTMLTKNFEPDVASAENLAMRESQGELVTETLDFLGITTPAVATKVAERAIRALSLPLGKGTLTVNRVASLLKPGDPIKVTWPDVGLSETVVRIGRMDFGSLEESKMSIDVVEDVFGATGGVFVTPPPSSWVPPTNPPDFSVGITVTPIRIETDSTAQLQLDIQNPWGHTILVEFAVTDAGVTGSYVTDPTIPYQSVVVNRRSNYDTIIWYRVTNTLYSLIIEEGNQIFSPLTGPGQLILSPTVSGAGVVDVNAAVDNTTTAVKFAASTAGFPSDATVRAATADTSAPFQALAILTLTPGQTAYIGAFGYNVNNTESPRANISITMGTIPISPNFSIDLGFDNGVDVVPVGTKRRFAPGIAGSIVSWRGRSDVVTNATWDIWKDTKANYPPTVGDSICASDKPQLVADDIAEDLAPTGWTLSFTANDEFIVNVDANSAATQLSLTLLCLKT